MKEPVLSKVLLHYILLDAPRRLSPSSPSVATEIRCIADSDHADMPMLAATVLGRDDKRGRRVGSPSSTVLAMPAVLAYLTS